MDELSTLYARPSERVLGSRVIHEAWIGGVSTRPVDKVVQTMRLSGIAKSQVFKLCRAGSTNAAKRERIRRPWTSLPTIHNGARMMAYRVSRCSSRTIAFCDPPPIFKLRDMSRFTDSR